MKYNSKYFALILFVLSATLILGSTTNAYAVHDGLSKGVDGSGALEGCLNDKAGFTAPCDTADEWKKGNIMGDASYSLGDSIPVRIDITDLDTNPLLYQELIIELDITKATGVVSHTFDYATTFDRTVTNANPCLVAVDNQAPSVCTGWNSSTKAIPTPSANTINPAITKDSESQPDTSFVETGPHQFTMFAPPGKTVHILHVDYVIPEGDPTVDDETQISIIFTTNSTNVIAAFGAHFASNLDWFLTAQDVMGQPYKVSCIEINTGGCNAHINIDASDILPLPAPTVTLFKALETGEADLDSFGLSIGVTGVSSGGTETFTAGEMPALDETGLEGYSFVEITGDDKCPTDATSLPASVDLLADGDAITCTIVNAFTEIPEATTITLFKSVDGGNAEVNAFGLTIGGVFVDSGVPLEVSANDDTITIDEVGLEGYTFGTITGHAKCPESLGGTVAALEEDEDIECTIINTFTGIIVEPESDSGDGGDNAWDTRPTFGVNHETREEIIVANGFIFNDESFTITNNHWTAFDEQIIQIGAVNSFTATVYASQGLKIQEFLFGIPEVGMGHLAEMRIEVWFDNAGEIDEIKVLQESEVIESTSLIITNQKVKCLEADIEENCYSTSMSAVFLETLADKTMAIKAMDWKLRDQTTYLNEGFDISGDSLNPMNTKMIPSTVRYEGLIKVTQNEKYSSYWTTDDDRIFEMNSFGSFKQINQEFKRFQDSGEPLTRLHSEFASLIEFEAERALKVFDASELSRDCNFIQCY